MCRGGVLSLGQRGEDREDEGPIGMGWPLPPGPGAQCSLPYTAQEWQLHPSSLVNQCLPLSVVHCCQFVQELVCSLPGPACGRQWYYVRQGPVTPRVLPAWQLLGGTPGSQFGPEGSQLGGSWGGSHMIHGRPLRWLRTPGGGNETCRLGPPLWGTNPPHPGSEGGPHLPALMLLPFTFCPGQVSSSA